MNIKSYWNLVLLLTLSCSTPESFDVVDVSQAVDPFIGTGGHGHTYPGATIPFGMVQLSPDNGTQGWDWSSGYHYSDSAIRGFSHTHLSGTGIGDLCDIQVIPAISILSDTGKIISRFSHKNESASPGYYSVMLDDFGVEAEFTTTDRVGFHRYTFPASEHAMIRFDLGAALNWDWPTQSHFKQINDSTFTGYRFSSGWGNNQQVYFAVRLKKKLTSLNLYEDKTALSKTNATAKDVKACLKFSTTNQETVLMKVGLSMADEAGALKSLQETPDWDFESVRKKAADRWNTELSRIQIKISDEKTKRIFYTALYHTYLAPTLFNDLNGNYKGTDGKIYNANKPVYTTQSLWDTFRAANPLLTLTQPDRIADIINSYLVFYDQHGLLPVWDLHFNETSTMTGYHAVPIIADAILKDIPGFDVAKAYEAMKKSSMQNIRGTDHYRNYGYLPHDKHVENVTITLEYAFDDWCIAAVAKKLGKKEDTDYYFQRASFYKNLFDKETGFFRPKLSDGKWASPFDPLKSEFQVNPYTEGNAWQHTFFVPHDINGLANLYGDTDNLIAKLDTLFTMDSKLTGTPVPDISGLIGQYAHGNEPSHHIAYMYSFLGAPEKTADRVRQIMTELYDDTPEGLSGNEDCGQMSAWYIFSALGFYPCNPASGEYILGSPLIDEATIQVADGKTFTVVVKNNSGKNKYIQAVKLNGSSYDKVYITHSAIIKGGTLNIEMGDTPNATWGKDQASMPYSLSSRQ
jgi:predicted alpha-1,2-mannosidase